MDDMDIEDLFPELLEANKSVEEEVSVDMRTKGFKEALKRAKLKAEKVAAKLAEKEKEKEDVKEEEETNSISSVTWEDVTAANVADAPKPLSMMKRKKKNG